VGKEGARRGTMGSPALNREDALVRWKDPTRAVAAREG
jgi:hypothetical protein